MDNKISKNTRVLDIYARLCEGKVICKVEDAKKFGVDERSIQRDIDDIRAYMNNKEAMTGQPTCEVMYSRRDKGFVLSGVKSSIMSNSEILAVSEILLASRAFTKDEVTDILDKMVSGCVPLRNMKLVSELIANEKYHYVQLHDDVIVQDKLWDVGENIKNHYLMDITYLKQGCDQKAAVKRIIEPAAVIFSEYYFYLNAYIVKENEKGEFIHRYDYPAVFRLDRIVEYKRRKEKFKVEYANRFEEGEFRKRVQFMYPGKLIRLKFLYKGKSVDAILDRLPTAKVISSKEEGHVIEAEVYGKGVLMWLLSQGPNVKVISPKSAQDEMIKMLTKMKEVYEHKG